MKLSSLDQLKDCIRSNRDVVIFRFYTGKNDYTSIWSIGEWSDDPHDKMSELLFDLSLKGRVLSSCKVEHPFGCWRKVFRIGTRVNPRHETNIDADLVSFFNDEIDIRREQNNEQKKD